MHLSSSVALQTSSSRLLISAIVRRGICRSWTCRSPPAAPAPARRCAWSGGSLGPGSATGPLRVGTSSNREARRRQNAAARTRASALASAPGRFLLLLAYSLRLFSATGMHSPPPLHLRRRRGPPGVRGRRQVLHVGARGPDARVGGEGDGLPHEAAVSVPGGSPLARRRAAVPGAPSRAAGRTGGCRYYTCVSQAAGQTAGGQTDQQRRRRSEECFPLRASHPSLLPQGVSGYNAHRHVNYKYNREFFVFMETVRKHLI